jgi:DNA-binding NarL/FixJ family response regulator
MSNSIFIVDDHPVMRNGYRFLFKNEPFLKVCGEAGSAAEALEKIPAAKPDLVLVDISLGGVSGISLIKDLKVLYPEILTLVVSAHDEMMYGERALLAGARGYVMKSEVDAVVVDAIQRVLRGGYFLSEEMNTKIMQQYQEKYDGPGSHETTGIQQLTDRELEVFELIGKGFSTHKIADSLNISPKTVESHRGRIKEKLALENTTELLQRATLWVERPTSEE